MAKFNVGDVLLGQVRQIQPYGAFVEANGVQGLLHISQISNERVMSMDGIFNVGDKIKVMVLTKETVDGKPKLGLTTRKLEPNPGDMLRNPKLVFDKARSREGQSPPRLHAREGVRMQPELLRLVRGFSAADVPAVCVSLQSFDRRRRRWLRSSRSASPPRRASPAARRRRRTRPRRKQLRSGGRAWLLFRAAAAMDHPWWAAAAREAGSGVFV